VQPESDGLVAAVQASVEQALVDDALRESAAMAASAIDSDAREGQNSFAALSESESELVDGETPVLPSRYASAVSGMGPSTLADSAFPPLPGGIAKGKHKPKNQKGPASMAALLGGGGGGGGRGGGGIRILNAAGPRPPSAAGSSSSRPSSANGDSHNIVGGTWASSNNSRPSTASAEVRPGGGWTSVSPSRRPPQAIHPIIRNTIQESESFPVIGAGLNGNHISRAKSDTPAVASGKKVDLVQQLSREELRAANKALKESIQAGLRGNEQAFSDFKDVSARYSKGEMNTLDYYRHIIRLGLSRVVPELGRLCPDPVKGKELIEVHAAQLAREQEFPTVASSSSSSVTAKPSSSGVAAGKGKGELEPSMQSSGRVSPQLPNNEEVEVLSRDGYRTARGKSRIQEATSSSTTSGVTEPGNDVTSRKPQVLVKASTGSFLEPESTNNPQAARSQGPARMWTCETCNSENREDSPKCLECVKRKKKISKFQRVRLGDGSAAALLDSRANSNPWRVISDVGNTAVPPAAEVRGYGRGAWANGGGSRLMSSSRKN